MAEICSICSTPLLRDVVKNASLCVYEGGKGAHAARGTSLIPVELPASSESCLMGSRRNNTPCGRENALIYTLIALLHSIKKLGIIIHLLKAEDIDPRIIIQTCEGMDLGKVYVILEVPQCTQAEREECVVYTTSTLEGISLPEPVALSIILRLQSSSPSAVFY